MPVGTYINDVMNPVVIAFPNVHTDRLQDHSIAIRSPSHNDGTSYHRVPRTVKGTDVYLATA